MKAESWLVTTRDAECDKGNPSGLQVANLVAAISRRSNTGYSTK